MSEDKLQSTINRGFHAKRLVEDELKDAFAKLDAEYTKEWKAETNPNRREAIWHGQMALGRLQLHLKQVITDGKMAMRDLETQKAKRK